eukprot:jgi/Mesvir1/19032/Mv12798-RA.1
MNAEGEGLVAACQVVLNRFPSLQENSELGQLVSTAGGCLTPQQVFPIIGPLLLHPTYTLAIGSAFRKHLPHLIIWVIRRCKAPIGRQQQHGSHGGMPAHQPATDASALLALHERLCVTLSFLLELCPQILGLVLQYLHSASPPFERLVRSADPSQPLAACQMLQPDDVLDADGDGHMADACAPPSAPWGSQAIPGISPSVPPCTLVDIAACSYRYLRLSPAFASLWNWAPLLGMLVHGTGDSSTGEPPPGTYGSPHGGSPGLASATVRWYAARCAQQVLKLSDADSSQLRRAALTQEEEAAGLQCWEREQAAIAIERARWYLDTAGLEPAPAGGQEGMDIDPSKVEGAASDATWSEDASRPTASLAAPDGPVAGDAPFVRICGIDLPRRMGSRTSTSPGASPLVRTPTTVRNLHAIVLALCRQQPLLLEGPTGAGKSALLNEVARLTGNTDMVRLYLDDQMDSKTLLGSYTCTDVPGQFSWRPGPLTQAVRRGLWVVFEDIDRAPFEIVSAIIPLLEGRQLFIAGRGEVIEAAHGFQCFATITHSGEGQVYGGSAVKDILSKLWTKVRVEPHGDNELHTILATLYPTLQPLLPRMIETLNALKRWMGGSALPSSSSVTSTPAESCPLPTPAAALAGMRRFSMRDITKWCRRMQVHVASGAGDAGQVSAGGGFSTASASAAMECSFLDAVDCLVGMLRGRERQVEAARALARLWNVTDDRVDYYASLHKPRLSVSKTEVTVGRARITITRETSGIRAGAGASAMRRPFVHTGHVMRLMEKLAVCARHREPVLLVGETGVGKTAIIQQLATALGVPLTAVNMSQQSDSTDFIGGYKPVEKSQLCLPLLERFSGLFRATFPSSKNEDFLSRVTKYAEKRKWALLLKAFRQAVGRIGALGGSEDGGSRGVEEDGGRVVGIDQSMAEMDLRADHSSGAGDASVDGMVTAKGKRGKKAGGKGGEEADASGKKKKKQGDEAAGQATSGEESSGQGGEVGASPPAARASKRARQLSPSLLEEWRAFSGTLSLVERQVDAAGSAFAFTFVEGVLIRALKEGHWVLLDEINLAPADTLERLAGLLDGEGSSLSLTERGDLEAVPRHPDFWIFAAMNPGTDVGKRELPPPLRSRFTELYVPELTDRDDLCLLVNDYLQGAALNAPVEGIVDFYLSARTEAETSLLDGANQKPEYSLRTLTRALEYTLTALPVYGLHRSLHDGLSMCFLTLLQRPCWARMERLIGQVVAASSKSLAKPPPRPGGGGEYALLENFWLEMGPHSSNASASSLSPASTASRQVEREKAYVLTPSVRQHLNNIARAVLVRRYPILLQGPTSSGKTSMVAHLASVTGHRFVRINNHEHTDLAEYLGSYVSDASGKLVFQEGALVEAVRRGYWIVLDELNLAPSDVLEALNRLLDDNRELFVPELQATIKPHPHFMLFATQNPPGVYGGRKVLSRAFRNRFMELHVDDIPDDELATIVEARCGIAPSYCAKLVEVMKELQRCRQGSAVFAGKHGFITPRDLFRWANRGAVGYLELARHGYMILAERLRSEEERAVVRRVLEKQMKVSLDVDAIYSLEGSDSFARLQQAVADPAVAASLGRIVWTKSMRRLFTLVDACLKGREPVLLVGETGCGKTTLCQMMAAMLGRKLHIINCHQNSETADFLGGFRPVRDKEDVAGRYAHAVASIREDIELAGCLRDLAGVDAGKLSTAVANGAGTLKLLTSALATVKSAVASGSDAASAAAAAVLSEDKAAGGGKKGKGKAGGKGAVDQPAREQPWVGAVERLSAAVDQLSTLLGGYRALFKWYDGPLVEAMRNGDMLLIDEISLAEDAVLERLNSVLEPSRTLVLAEAGGEAVDELTAHPDFLILATMNPGGDFGKKELSPALRNRFTEVWVTAVSDFGDLRAIVADRLADPPALPPLVDPLMAFWEWYLGQACAGALSASSLASHNTSSITGSSGTGRSLASSTPHPKPGVGASGAPSLIAGNVSIRDLLSWVTYIRGAHAKLGPWKALLHGGFLVLLDGLGLGTGVSDASARAAKANCLQYLLSLVPEELRPELLASCTVPMVPAEGDSGVATTTSAMASATTGTDGRGMTAMEHDGDLRHGQRGQGRDKEGVANSDVNSMVDGKLASGRKEVVHIVDGEGVYGIPPFFIPKGPYAVRPSSHTSSPSPLPLSSSAASALSSLPSSSPPSSAAYALGAPTTAVNAMRLLRALQLPRPVLLEGAPGVGKTSLVAALASVTGHRLVRINLSEQTDMIDLLGSDLPVESGTGGEFRWCDGVFLQALKAGDWVLLDEMNLASQSILEGLNACLDHRAEVFIPDLNKTFHCPPSFRIFAAQNPVQQGGGRKGLPRSFLNRFTKVFLDELTPADLLHIVSALYAGIPTPTLARMIAFNARVHRDTMVDRAYAHAGAPWEFNLRDVLRWCQLMLSAATPPAASRDVDADSPSTGTPGQSQESNLAPLGGQAQKQHATTAVDGNPKHVGADTNAAVVAKRRARACLVDPGLFLDVVYLQRLRSAGDRARVRQVYESIFGPLAPSLVDAHPPVTVTPRLFQVGRAVLPRQSAPGAASWPRDLDDKVLLTCRLPALRAVMQVVSQGWMALLLGGPCSGKSSLVRLLARATGNVLHEYTLTSGVDTSELLGCFEQADAVRNAQKLLADVEAAMDAACGAVLAGRGRGDSQSYEAGGDGRSRDSDSIMLEQDLGGGSAGMRLGNERLEGGVTMGRDERGGARVGQGDGCQSGCPFRRKVALVKALHMTWACFRRHQLAVAQRGVGAVAGSSASMCAPPGGVDDISDVGAMTSSSLAGLDARSVDLLIHLVRQMKHALVEAGWGEEGGEEEKRRQGEEGQGEEGGQGGESRGGGGAAKMDAVAGVLSGELLASLTAFRHGLEPHHHPSSADGPSSAGADESSSSAPSAAASSSSSSGAGASAGRFQWVDGVLLTALERGHWVLLENANFCSATVLDRLNPLLEPGGSILVSERGLVDGAPLLLAPHPNFRLFLTLDPAYGDVSRAMRNRGIEVFLLPDGTEDDPTINSHTGEGSLAEAWKEGSALAGNGMGKGGSGKPMVGVESREALDGFGDGKSDGAISTEGSAGTALPLPLERLHGVGRVTDASAVVHAVGHMPGLRLARAMVAAHLHLASVLAHRCPGAHPVTLRELRGWVALQRQLLERGWALLDAARASWQQTYGHSVGGDEQARECARAAWHVWLREMMRGSAFPHASGGECQQGGGANDHQPVHASTSSSRHLSGQNGPDGANAFGTTIHSGLAPMVASLLPRGAALELTLADPQGPCWGWARASLARPAAWPLALTLGAMFGDSARATLMREGALLHFLAVQARAVARWATWRAQGETSALLDRFRPALEGGEGEGGAPLAEMGTHLGGAAGLPEAMLRVLLALPPAVDASSDSSSHGPLASVLQRRASVHHVALPQEMLWFAALAFFERSSPADLGTRLAWLRQLLGIGSGDSVDEKHDPGARAGARGGEGDLPGATQAGWDHISDEEGTTEGWYGDMEEGLSSSFWGSHRVLLASITTLHRLAGGRLMARLLAVRRSLRDVCWHAVSDDMLAAQPLDARESGFWHTGVGLEENGGGTASGDGIVGATQGQVLGAHASLPRQAVKEAGAPDAGGSTCNATDAGAIAGEAGREAAACDALALSEARAQVETRDAARWLWSACRVLYRGAMEAGVAGVYSQLTSSSSYSAGVSMQPGSQRHVSVLAQSAAQWSASREVGAVPGRGKSGSSARSAIAWVWPLFQKLQMLLEEVHDHHASLVLLPPITSPPPSAGTMANQELGGMLVAPQAADASEPSSSLLTTVMGVARWRHALWDSVCADAELSTERFFATWRCFKKALAGLARAARLDDPGASVASTGNNATVPPDPPHNSTTQPATQPAQASVPESCRRAYRDLRNVVTVIDEKLGLIGPATKPLLWRHGGRPSLPPTLELCHAEATLAAVLGSLQLPAPGSDGSHGPAPMEPMERGEGGDELSEGERVGQGEEEVDPQLRLCDAYLLDAGLRSLAVDGLALFQHLPRTGAAASSASAAAAATNMLLPGSLASKRANGASAKKVPGGMVGMPGAPPASASDDADITASVLETCDLLREQLAQRRRRHVDAGGHEFVSEGQRWRRWMDTPTNGATGPGLTVPADSSAVAAGKGAGRALPAGSDNHTMIPSHHLGMAGPGNAGSSTISGNTTVATSSLVAVLASLPACFPPELLRWRAVRRMQLQLLPMVDAAALERDARVVDAVGALALRCQLADVLRHAQSWVTSSSSSSSSSLLDPRSRAVGTGVGAREPASVAGDVIATKDGNDASSAWQLAGLGAGSGWVTGVADMVPVSALAEIRECVRSGLALSLAAGSRPPSELVPHRRLVWVLEQAEEDLALPLSSSQPPSSSLSSAAYASSARLPSTMVARLPELLHHLQLCWRQGLRSTTVQSWPELALAPLDQRGDGGQQAPGGATGASSLGYNLPSHLSSSGASGGSSLPLLGSGPVRLFQAVQTLYCVSAAHTQYQVRDLFPRVLQLRFALRHLRALPATSLGEMSRCDASIARHQLLQLMLIYAPTFVGNASALTSAPARAAATTVTSASSQPLFPSSSTTTPFTSELVNALAILSAGTHTDVSGTLTPPGKAVLASEVVATALATATSIVSRGSSHAILNGLIQPLLLPCLDLAFGRQRATGDAAGTATAEGGGSAEGRMDDRSHRGADDGNHSSSAWMARRGKLWLLLGTLRLHLLLPWDSCDPAGSSAHKAAAMEEELGSACVELSVRCAYAALLRGAAGDSSGKCSDLRAEVAALADQIASRRAKCTPRPHPSQFSALRRDLQSHVALFAEAPKVLALATMLERAAGAGEGTPSARGAHATGKGMATDKGAVATAHQRAQALAEAAVWQDHAGSLCRMLAQRYPLYKDVVAPLQLALEEMCAGAATMARAAECRPQAASVLQEAAACLMTFPVLPGVLTPGHAVDVKQLGIEGTGDGSGQEVGVHPHAGTSPAVKQAAGSVLPSRRHDVEEAGDDGHPVGASIPAGSVATPSLVASQGSHPPGRATPSSLRLVELSRLASHALLVPERAGGLPWHVPAGPTGQDPSSEEKRAHNARRRAAISLRLRMLRAALERAHLEAGSTRLMDVAAARMLSGVLASLVQAWEAVWELKREKEEEEASLYKNKVRTVTLESDEAADERTFRAMFPSSHRQFYADVAGDGFSDADEESRGEGVGGGGGEQDVDVDVGSAVTESEVLRQLVSLHARMFVLDGRGGKAWGSMPGRTPSPTDATTTAAGAGHERGTVVDVQEEAEASALAAPGHARGHRWALRMSGALSEEDWRGAFETSYAAGTEALRCLLAAGVAPDKSLDATPTLCAHVCRMAAEHGKLTQLGPTMAAAPAVTKAGGKGRSKTSATPTDDPSTARGLEARNLYRDSCPDELALLHGPVAELLEALRRLLEEWPEHPVLEQLRAVCQRLMSLPLDSPLMRALVGLELLLSRAQLWEENAAKHVSLGEHLDRLSAVVLRWRKLELASWRAALAGVREAQEAEAEKSWFVLYALVHRPMLAPVTSAGIATEGEAGTGMFGNAASGGGDASTPAQMVGLKGNDGGKGLAGDGVEDGKGSSSMADTGRSGGSGAKAAVGTGGGATGTQGITYASIAETSQAVEQFLALSSLGQFRKRLAMVRSFYCQMDAYACLGMPPPGVSLDGCARLAHVLFNMHAYYAQFVAAVEEAIAKQSAGVHKELDDFVKLARWEDRNYYSMEASAEKAHRRLHKLTRKYDAVLTQPIGPVIAEVAASVGGERTMAAEAGAGDVAQQQLARLFSEEECQRLGALCLQAWQQGCSAQAAMFLSEAIPDARQVAAPQSRDGTSTASIPLPTSIVRAASEDSLLRGLRLSDDTLWQNRLPSLTRRMQSLLLSCVISTPRLARRREGAAAVEGLAMQVITRVIELRQEAEKEQQQLAEKQRVAGEEGDKAAEVAGKGSGRNVRKKAFADLLKALRAIGLSHRKTAVPPEEREVARWFQEPPPNHVAAVFRATLLPASTSSSPDSWQPEDAAPAGVAGADASSQGVGSWSCLPSPAVADASEAWRKAEGYYVRNVAQLQRLWQCQQDFNRDLSLREVELCSAFCSHLLYLQRLQRRTLERHADAFEGVSQLLLLLQGVGDADRSLPLQDFHRPWVWRQKETLDALFSITSEMQLALGHLAQVESTPLLASAVHRARTALEVEAATVRACKAELDAWVLYMPVQPLFVNGDLLAVVTRNYGRLRGMAARLRESAAGGKGSLQARELEQGAFLPGWASLLATADAACDHATAFARGVSLQESGHLPRGSHGLGIDEMAMDGESLAGSSGGHSDVPQQQQQRLSLSLSFQGPASPNAHAAVEGFSFAYNDAVKEVMLAVQKVAKATVPSGAEDKDGAGMQDRTGGVGSASGEASATGQPGLGADDDVAQLTKSAAAMEAAMDALQLERVAAAVSQAVTLAARAIDASAGPATLPSQADHGSSATVDASISSAAAFPQPHPDVASAVSTLLRRLVPSLAMLRRSLQVMLADYVLLHKATAKLCHVLVNLFATLATQGFCGPREQQRDGEGAGGPGKFEDDVEGTGMGEGVGKTDVSDQIEDEEQLMGTKDQEKGETKKEEGDGEAKGVEMQQDFDGEMFDLSDDDEAEGEDEPEEGEERLEQEMGDVGNDADVVDEKMWGDDDKKEDGKENGGQQEEKYEKDAPISAGKQEKEYRGAEDDKEGRQQKGGEEDEMGPPPEEGGEEEEEEDMKVNRHGEGEEENTGIQPEKEEELQLPDDMDLDGVQGEEEEQEEQQGGADDREGDQPPPQQKLVEECGKTAGEEEGKEEQQGEDGEEGGKEEDGDGGQEEEGKEKEGQEQDAPREDDDVEADDNDESKGEGSEEPPAAPPLPNAPNDEADKVEEDGKVGADGVPEVAEEEPKGEKEEEEEKEREEDRTQRARDQKAPTDAPGVRQGVQGEDTAMEEEPAEEAPARERVAAPLPQEEGREENEDRSARTVDDDPSGSRREKVAGQSGTLEDAAEAPKQSRPSEANPLRSLGDAMREWKQRLHMLEEEEKKSQEEARKEASERMPVDDATAVDEAGTFEYCPEGEEEEADAQALGPATEEQVQAMGEEEKRAVSAAQEDKEAAAVHAQDAEKDEAMEEEGDKGDEGKDDEGVDVRVQGKHKKPPLDTGGEEGVSDQDEQGAGAAPGELVAPDESARGGRRDDAEQQAFASVAGFAKPQEASMLPPPLAGAHRLLVEDRPFSQEELASLRQELQAEIEAARDAEAPGAREARARDIWRKYDALTGATAHELAEQLRLILEPTLATKLAGDYRSGKRISMKRVITYIASQFRKDKIWLRRTRPNRREYQVVVAIDDSRSMGENGCGALALEATAVICKAMAQLEIGDLSIIRFGGKEKVLPVHDFGQPFGEEAGVNLVSAFDFSQDNTIRDEPMLSLLQFLSSSLSLAKARLSQRAASAELQQLVIVIADGRFHEKETLRRALHQVGSPHQLLAFLVLDNPAQSILDMQSVSFAGGKATFTKYMDSFPFPYYMLLQDIHALPRTLADLLRQWFEIMQRMSH